MDDGLIAMDKQASSWSNYWVSGKPSTFGGIDDLAANPALSQLWLRALTDRLGSSILEVGCGNGALTRFLPSILKERHPDATISAIDIARLSDALSPSHGVTFYPETGMEELPFDDDSFDAVVSQFGFEYAEFAPALRELARVSKVGASVTFIAHHRSSWLCRDSFDILRQVLAIEESAILVTLDALVNQLALLHSANRDPTKDLKAEKYREILNVTAKELQEDARKLGADPSYTLRFLDAVFKVFDDKSRRGLNHLQYLAEISESMFAYKERLESQKRAAPDDDEWEVKSREFVAHGFRIDRFEPAVINGYHFGHLVGLTKAA